MRSVAADIFSFIQPMMALRVRDLPTGNWIYEMKFDGYRALAIKADKEVRLISRNRKSFNDDYPVLIDFQSSDESTTPRLSVTSLTF
jgi:ATP-dependent DNA ligase